ncbi:MAG: VCBS repeat-containing protein [Bradymonadales bacterium]
MMKFSILTISSFALGLFLFSCNNDTINDNSGDACEFVVCEDGEQCKNGECVDNSNLCDATLNICIDEITIKQCVLGEIPRTVQCSLTEQCKDGECIPRAADEKCTLTSSSCINETTVKECSEGSDPYIYQCEAEKICRNGKCTAKPGKIGEECKDRDCEDGAFCSLDEICEKFIPLGEACIFLETFCEVPYECINNLCQRKLELGDDCGEFDFCSGGVCHNGKCTKVSEHYDDCDLEKPCATGAVCIDGKCIPTKGDCNHKDECTGDSYCCLEASCAPSQNKCVPYSNENPNDTTCSFETKPGIFEASVQCEWTGTSDPGALPASNQVMSTIMVADLPFDSAHAAELVLKTFNPGAIRIFNGETCELLQTISEPNLQAEGNLALADLNNDGNIEIVVSLVMGPVVVAYKWESGKYVDYWRSDDKGTRASWGGPSIHDIDDDGYPEVFVGNTVYDGRTGAVKTRLTPSVAIPIVANLDGKDGVEFVGSPLLTWQGNAFVTLTNLAIGNTLFAYADFGTESANFTSFDFTTLDGIAEIVVVVGGNVSIYTINGQRIMSAGGFTKGGPPNIGDFDGDTLPEIGIAGGDMVAIFDPQCEQADENCEGSKLLWRRESQDNSSGVTGTTIFDFDGDGRAEVIYGDECYTRVYDGKTGEVLFSSYRTSNTAYENPTIADIDGDGSTEIVIGSDAIAPPCPLIDPTHRGVKCTEDADCYKKNCVDGYCRCHTADDCNWQKNSQGDIMTQYACDTPLTPQDIAHGKVCRATHPAGIKAPGFQVLRDRLDRWVSSRAIWNQHAYSITNINDDGTVPKTSEWKQNFVVPGLNNFRQQAQGATGAGFAPDITGRFTSSADVCKSDAEGKVLLKGQVCNRGTKAVGSKMPAVFYVDSIDAANILCVSYTDEMVPVGGCRMVDCEITQDKVGLLKNKKIIMQVNDDGKGGKTTVECNEDNNTDEIFIESCMVN